MTVAEPPYLWLKNRKTQIEDNERNSLVKRLDGIKNRMRANPSVAH
jgi:hypothetical protein